MNIVIRPYKETDRQDLIEISKDFQDYLADLDDLGRIRKGSEFDAEKYLSRLLSKIKDENGVLSVALDNNIIVGFVAGIIPTDDPLDHLETFSLKDGEILDLYVLEIYRGKGVGRKLMETMEKYFQDHDCVGCHVDYFNPNTQAHEFYKKGGYTDRLTSMLKIF